MTVSTSKLIDSKKENHLQAILTLISVVLFILSSVSSLIKKSVFRKPTRKKCNEESHDTLIHPMKKRQKSDQLCQIEQVCVGTIMEKKAIKRRRLTDTELIRNMIKKSEVERVGQFVS